MKMTASQIVDKLLEFSGEGYPAPVGGPDDPMRQTTGPLPPMRFNARPGTNVKKVLGDVIEPGDLLDEPAAPPDVAKPAAPAAPGGPVPIKMHPRFKWKPPQRPGL